MNIQQAIKAVTEDHDLSREEMESVMREIMTGAATPAQIGGFLIGLRMKGETIDEITAAASVMRSLATRVEVDLPHLVDTCGTGGDSSGTFNVSTASAFVAAAAGAHVAKHGNRSVSSRSGSTRTTTLPRILPFGNCSLSTVAMNPPSSVVILVIFSTVGSPVSVPL